MAHLEAHSCLSYSFDSNIEQKRSRTVVAWMHDDWLDRAMALAKACRFVEEFLVEVVVVVVDPCALVHQQAC